MGMDNSTGGNAAATDTTPAHAPGVPNGTPSAIVDGAGGARGGAGRGKNKKGKKTADGVTKP